MPGRSKLSLQKRGKLQQPPLPSPADTPAANSIPTDALSPSWGGGRGTSKHQTTCPAEDASSSLISEASSQEEGAFVTARCMEAASLLETPASPKSMDVCSSKMPCFECILCGRKCGSSQVSCTSGRLMGTVGASTHVCSVVLGLELLHHEYGVFSGTTSPS